MAAPTGLYTLRKSPAIESISGTMYQNMNLKIDEAISTRDVSVLEKKLGDFTGIILLDKEPESSPLLQDYKKEGSFYPVLIKYVSQGEYDCIVTFLEEFQKLPNSELLITDEIFLCGVACLYTIDPNGWHDQCAGMIQDRKLRSADLGQHFDTLMLSDPEYTEFYRPLAQFFKQ